MDDFKAYLARLAQDLKERIPSEQDEILAEIESHIEEGLEDRRMGAGGAERGAKVLMELGSPTEMADGLYYAQARRWQGLALALIPLAIIFLIRATIIQLWMGEKVIIPDNFYLVDFAMMPLYAVMLKVVWRRKSRPLTLWWLSWSSLYSTSVLLQAMMRKETPLWVLLILGLLFCLSLSTFAVKLWQARQDGLLVAFATLPYALSVIQYPMQGTAITYFTPLEQTLSVGMQQIHFLCYIPLASVIFLLQERQKRWLWLIATVMLYVVLLAWLLWPMPLIYFLPYWIVLSLPLITGLLIDYRQTPPFLST